MIKIEYSQESIEALQYWRFHRPQCKRVQALAQEIGIELLPTYSPNLIEEAANCKIGELMGSEFSKVQRCSRCWANAISCDTIKESYWDNRLLNRQRRRSYLRPLRVYLRELTRSDLQYITQWRHDPELIASLCTPFRYINPETEDQWFEHYLQNRHNTIRWAICKQETHQHIGNVYLLHMDWIHRTAEFHIFIGDLQDRGKGYGKEATRMALEYAFFHLNLRRIELKVLKSNHLAIQMYEKCEFRHEGLLRQAVFKNGNYEDVCIMGILRDEFSL